MILSDKMREYMAAHGHRVETGPNLTELDKLHEYLKAHGYRVERCDETPSASLAACYESMGKPASEGERHQLIVRNKDGSVFFDVICHHGSYGYEWGLLEIQGPGNLLLDRKYSVEGYLSADEIIRRLETRLTIKQKKQAGLFVGEIPKGGW